MKKRRFLLIPVLAAIVSLSVISLACGDDNGNNDGNATNTPASTAATSAATTANETPSSTGEGAPGASTTIDATVTEAPFGVTATPDTAPAGAVTFDVTNSGAITHSFYVIKTDLAADQLPVDEAAFKVDEAQVDIVGEIETDELQAGATASMTDDLAAGHYVLICNVPSHYQSGMRTDFTVE